MGVGPFEKGSIYDSKRFAGKDIGTEKRGLIGSSTPVKSNQPIDRQLSYRDTHSFQHFPKQIPAATVRLASAEEDVEDEEASE